MNYNINDPLQTMFPPDGTGLKPYEWMINPTRQQQWIDNQGIYLWLAFFFSEIGAGLYFISLFYKCGLGLAIGWVVTLILGGAIHVRYLGNPKNAWRMIMKPKTSELSRGIWFIGIFALLGFIQLITGSYNIPLSIIMGILCLLIISHGFVTMNVIRALPAWSSNMVLPLSLISGIWVGHQILQFILSFAKPELVSGMEIFATIFFFAYVLCIVLYGWGTFHSNEIGRESILMMLKDKKLRKITLAGVGGLAIVLPLIFVLIMWGGSTNGFWVFLRMCCVIAGDLAIRYVIMKSALYQPLIARN